MGPTRLGLSVRGAGVICVNDEDCEGPHSICVNGLCNCPLNFELYALDQKTSVCRPGKVAKWTPIG